MKKFTAFKLYFSGPLHLGQGKSEYTSSFQILHSDTLKSALYYCALQLYGEEEINKNFLESFTISSGYPFCDYGIKGEKTEFFFPVPGWFNTLFHVPKQEEEKKENGAKTLRKKIKEKDVKKLQFIGKDLFEEILHGQNPVIEPEYCNSFFKYASRDLPREKLDSFIREKETRQRVAIAPFRNEYQLDEKNSSIIIPDPEPYYEDQLFFEEGAGLYFLVQYDEQQDKTISKKVRAALRLLGDSGIGTNRNIGNGQFSYKQKIMELNLPESSNCNYEMALSLYLPREEEITEEILKGSAYDLKKRGGFISSPSDFSQVSLRKKSVYMFSEGSVFLKKTESEDIKGKIVDLAPESLVKHSIYRDGRAMFFPISIPESN